MGLFEKEVNHTVQNKKFLVFAIDNKSAIAIDFGYIESIELNGYSLKEIRDGATIYRLDLTFHMALPPNGHTLTTQIEHAYSTVLDEERLPQSLLNQYITFLKGDANAD